jgi:hypothetical protein
LRIRAERRVGELLAAQAEPGERQSVGRPKKVTDADHFPKPRLADQVVTKNESSAYQKLAAVDEPTFEKAIDQV